MNKKILCVLACALAFPLVESCSPSPSPKPKYNVIVDSSVGHISVEGKKEGILAGKNVDLTITATDGFNLLSEYFRLYQNNNDKTEVEYTWSATSAKLEFVMPASDVVFAGAIKDPEYDICLDKYTHLDGGDVEVNGVKLHFDENSVKENCDTGFIEMAPFGSLYLESYLPGITEVFVKEIYDGEPDGGYCLGASSTPNSIDGPIWYSQTTEKIILSPDQPYFSINNREKELVIEFVKMKYQPNDVEKDLKELIKVDDLSTSFDPNNLLNPYEVNPIDESKIPDNRIVKPIEPLTYTEPGEYIYGYEVYSKTKDGNMCKLLYSSTAKCVLKGSSTFKHWAVFHLKDKVVTLQVGNNQKVDISTNEEISRYNWKNDFNDLDTPFTSDRHFYPEYSVVGLPNHKNGDGCYPISCSYNAFDGHIDMPDPDMMKGYTFGGWFMDFDCTVAFDPDASYAGDITLYAKCLEKSKQYRKVYYYDYDGTSLNRIDYLEEKDGSEIALPTFADIKTKLVDGTTYETKMYEVRMGANRVKMLRPKGYYPIEETEYQGDKLKYEDIKDFGGDVKLIVSKVVVYTNPLAAFTIFFQDLDDNTVASGFTMDEVYQSGDRILVGRYADWNKDWTFDYSTYYDPQRCDEFTVTDAVDGYIIDQGSYNSIATYGYGNKYSQHSKPLQGILRHDSVIKVNRRAFFNRYGLVGTYFPKNAREFGLESYTNTHFNGRLLLPKNLDTIGARAFVGSSNIKVVCLPKSIVTVGQGAFSLADYDEETFEFTNVRYRNEEDKIEFYYEGSEKDFAKLDDATKKEILSNASIIHYNVSYNPYYGR